MMNEEWEGKDQSGYGNDATLHGVTLVDGPTGEKRTAFAFAGSKNSYLSVRGSDSLDVGRNGSFSFTSWVYVIKKFGAFVDYGNPTGMHVWSWPSYTVFAMPYGSATLSILFNTLPIPPKTWSFIGISYDNASLNSICVVGDKNKSMVLDVFNIITNTSYITFGKHNCRPPNPKSHFRGSMSCAMIFNAPLSADDMNRAKRYCMKMAKPYSKSIFVITPKEGAHGNKRGHHLPEYILFILKGIIIISFAYFIGV
jgi:hypothetical protein